MWLSRQMKPAMPTADADLGVTTIAGEQAGVVTRGEVRALPVYGPGGYAWLPENGMAVLVIKGGPGGEEQCVTAARPVRSGGHAARRGLSLRPRRECHIPAPERDNRTAGKHCH